MNPGLLKAIRVVGSIRKLARQLEVDRKAVQRWLRVGCPPRRAKAIVAAVASAATKKKDRVTLHELRPDLWE